MDLKELLLNKKLYNKLSNLPTSTKIGLGVLGFILGTNLYGAVNSKVQTIKFNSMHSGSETSMSHYSNMNMTDFGSGWKGLSNRILNLTKTKNQGLSEVLKVATTPFNLTGVDLGRTMIKMTSNTSRRHKIVRINKSNIVLDTHKERIGHMLWQ